MNVPLTLTQFLDRAVSLYGPKEAIYCEGRAFTYNDLNERVNRLSYGLRKFGVKKGGGESRLFGTKYSGNA